MPAVLALGLEPQNKTETVARDRGLDNNGSGVSAAHP